jgi:N utilization substance protein B
MGVRRKARECALQVLFAQERGPMRASALEAFWDDAEAPAEARSYAERLVHLVTDHRAAIDGAIARAAENWTLERMSRVDRNLLRVAVAELFFMEDVPMRVALDEAIEIAKRFGGEDSGRFVNGILDRVARDAPPKGSTGGEADASAPSDLSDSPVSSEGPEGADPPAPALAGPDPADLKVAGFGGR